MLFFWIRLKNASNIAFWLAALLVPGMILSLGLLFGGGNMAIQVGVYGDLQIESPGWTLLRYEDRDQLRQDVANMRLELGYAFGDGRVTLYARDATVADRVTNLLVAAAHLKTVTGEIGADALPFPANPGDIQARAEEYLAAGLLMDMVVVSHSEGAVLEEVVPFRRLFHGMLALFAQLFAMLCALGFANSGEGAVLRRLKIAGAAGRYVFSGFAAVFAMSAAIMAITIMAAAWLFPGVWLASDIPAAVVYLAAISALALALAMALPEGVYPTVLITGFIFTVLMGGVIFDLREVLEAASFLRFLFPSYYYMRVI